MTEGNGSAAGSYLYDQAWTDERARLKALSEIYDPGTFRLLEQLGVAPSWACLDVGAGEGSVARWLAGRVTEPGRVLAVDLDPRFLEGSGTVDVRQHDILTGPPEAGAFDLVHARALVEWVPDRPTAIANLVAAAKPGGIVLIEDVDMVPMRNAYPASEVRTIAADAFLALAAAGGADLTFGRQLLAAVHATGLVDVGCDVRTTLQRGGDPSTAFQRLTLKQLGPAMVANHMITTDQVSALDAELDDPDRYGYPPLMVAVWGRRPAQ